MRRNMQSKWVIITAIVLLISGSCSKSNDNQEPHIYVEKVTLNRSTISLEVGAKETLIAEIIPENATNPNLEWSSDHENIVKVSPFGEVTALSDGQAIVTAVSREDNNIKASCTVLVAKPHIPVEAITLNTSALALEVGQTETMIATILPENATNPNVTWSSSDKEVATISESGEVTAVSNGEAVIIAMSNDRNDIKASCLVTVEKGYVPVEKIVIEDEGGTIVHMGVGDTRIFRATVFPEDASNKDIVWSSSDESIAVISESGEVTSFYTIGSTIITAMSKENNNIYASFELYIQDHRNLLTEEYIPDPAFRIWISENLAEGSYYFSFQQAYVGGYSSTFFMTNEGIHSLQGIEYFQSLKTLYVSGNFLTTLDLSNNPFVKNVDCSNNFIVSLTLNDQIEELRCSNNRLSSLEIDHCVSLEYLNCADNLLSSLNLNNNVNLQRLISLNNHLKSIELPNHPKLSTLNCTNNEITSLTLSSDNLLSLYVSNNHLTQLELNRCPNIKTLSCGNNKIKTIDLGNLAYLTNLTISSNDITVLDISKNTYLRNLQIYDTPLQKIKVWNGFKPENIDIFGLSGDVKFEYP